MLCHASAWQRDDMRLRDLLPRVATLPLGSGALAGNPFLVDRQFIAKELGMVRLPSPRRGPWEGPGAAVRQGVRGGRSPVVEEGERPRAAGACGMVLMAGVVVAGLQEACAAGGDLWSAVGRGLSRRARVLFGQVTSGPETQRALGGAVHVACGAGGRRVPQLDGRRERPRLRPRDGLLLLAAHGAPQPVSSPTVWGGVHGAHSGALSRQARDLRGCAWWCASPAFPTFGGSDARAA